MIQREDVLVKSTGIQIPAATVFYAHATVANLDPRRSCNIRIVVFQWNGEPKVLSDDEFNIPPLGFEEVFTRIAPNHYEVRIEVDSINCLTTVFGTDQTGTPQPGFTVLNSELTPVDVPVNPEVLRKDRIERR
ncbi:hypothetical protein VQL36_11115 [Chengkuizengella sp. SCS-71B]|uniref:hypothetical protein n=1 Tax=Chengkuizengella sp. SCS-71B TaxID=3115290 RepID=UPI0032C22556